LQNNSVHFDEEEGCESGYNQGISVMTKPEINIRKKAMVSVMVLIIIASLICMVVFICHEKSDTSRIIEIQHIAVISLADEILQQVYQHYPRRLKNFIDYESAGTKKEIIDAFAGRDRQRLLKLTLPFLEGFKKENKYFDSLAWILPDNTVFLRVQYPEKYGDDISASRTDIAAVNRDHKPVTGFAVGPMGLQFRVVSPVFYGGVYLGAIQFGLDSRILYEGIEERIYEKTCLVVSRDVCHLAYDVTRKKVECGQYVIRATDAAFFSDIKDQLVAPGAKRRIFHEGRYYMPINVKCLNDYSGKKLGDIVVALDITQEVLHSQQSLLIVFFLEIFLLFFSYVILNKSFASLLNRISNLNNELAANNQMLEQRVAERTSSLQRAKEEWERTFDAVPDMIAILDAKFRIIRMNQRVIDNFGVSYQETLLKPCYQLMHGVSTPPEECPHCQLLKDHQFHSAEMYNEQIDRYLQVDVIPLFDEKNELYGSVHIARDITERKKNEEERTEIERQLRHAQKMESVGRLAGGIAHDFNNILSAINGYAELCLMRMDADSEHFREELEIILQAGQRAARLTQKLLAFSRKQIIRQELLNLNIEVGEMRKMLGRLLGEDIEIETKLEEGLWFVKADRSQIEQVLLNLAVNARDALPAKGKLTIETANVSLDEDYVRSHFDIGAGRYVMLAVSDDGEGIAASIKEKIFEPFFSTKDSDKGTGLGLAMVYGIVKQNGGDVHVYSEPGEGTTFKIYLPQALPDGQQNKQIATVGDMKIIGHETIVLAEDDALVRAMLVSVLSESGYTVLEAENGRNALRICQEHQGVVDLLLTDVIMPVMGGVELAENITAIYPEITILFMSGYTESAIIDHGVLKDDINFITKPISPPDLTAAVRHVLARGRIAELD